MLQNGTGTWLLQITGADSKYYVTFKGDRFPEVSQSRKVLWKSRKKKGNRKKNQIIKICCDNFM